MRQEDRSPETAGWQRTDPAQPDAPPQSERPPYGAPPPVWNQARPAPFDPRAKSPVLASLLSMLPGLGHIYLGYYQRGFVHAFVFGAFVAFMSSAEAGEEQPLGPMIGVLGFFFFLYNIIDAGRRAALYNLALQGGTIAPLPDDIALPGFRGSLAGGLVLIAAGFILLLNTRFGVSLDWLNEWWPVAPILLGLYLIYKNFDSHRASARGAGKDSPS